MIIRKAHLLPEFLLSNLYDQEENKVVSPALNIVENTDGFRLELAVPGVSKEDIKVDVDKDNNLVISASQKAETEEKQENYLRKEFSYSTFSKKLTLPENVDKDAITASYSNGVLIVEVPQKAKAEEEVKSIVVA